MAPHSTNLKYPTSSVDNLTNNATAELSNTIYTASMSIQHTCGSLTEADIVETWLIPIIVIFAIGSLT